jgi:hypothetical protein
MQKEKTKRSKESKIIDIERKCGSQKTNSHACTGI